MVCQGLDPAAARAAWQPFFAWVHARTQDFEVIEDLNTYAGSARGWWDVRHNPSMIPDPRPGAPAWHGWWKGDSGQVGAFLYGFDSLWLPAAHADADRIAAAAQILRKLVPNAGSYVSESNYFNPRWQAAYWGGNYRRLRAVKAKYDPDGLYFGHNGVGSEDWSVDGFTRTG